MYYIVWKILVFTVLGCYDWKFVDYCSRLSSNLNLLADKNKPSVVCNCNANATLSSIEFSIVYF